MKSKFFNGKSAKSLILELTMVILLLPYSLLMGGSVYVIADLNQSPCPINSYDIQGNSLVFQTQQTVPDIAGGAVGLAIDTISKTLFVTYEFSSTINLMDAQFMTHIGSTTAPGASDLAGTVYDHDNQRLYAIDRNTNHLYVYSWNAATTTLTLIGGSYTSIPGTSDGYGLALDALNDILYVGNHSGGNVSYYNTSNLNVLGGSISTSHTPTGVAIDVPNQIVYSCSGGPYGGQTISKVVLSTMTETTTNYGSTTLGVAVNQISGYLYVTFYGGGTYGDNIVVVDPSTMAVTWNSGDIGNPTAVVVSEGVGYNPLDLNKVDNLGGNCVQSGSNITYTLSFTNMNQTGVTGVTLTDQLPTNVSFVSCTGGGNHVGGVVSWTIGNLAPGAGGSFDLVVTVNEPPNGTVVNNSTISSAETGQSSATITTGVCQGPPPQVPISNWSIIFAATLMGLFIWFRRGKIFG